jgi:hypothetical protein
MNSSHSTSHLIIKNTRLGFPGQSELVGGGVGFTSAAKADLLVDPYGAAKATPFQIGMKDRTIS